VRSNPAKNCRIVTSVYDHYRTTDADAVRQGVYRVVGVDDEDVVLLRVGDTDGERVHTGETVRIARDRFGELEPATNPDAERSPVDAVASVPETAYWSVRAFADQAASRPFVSSIALASVVVGFLGDAVAFLPDTVSGVLILVGSLTLAYVGSGRL
jgi:hypothetical protein